MKTICTDWISATINCNPAIINNYIIENQCKPAQSGYFYRNTKKIAQFSNALEVIDDGFVIAKFFYGNHLRYELGQIFITNEVNYCNCWKISEIITNICNDLFCLFKRWCRIDIAIDFDFYEDFLDLPPLAFLQLMNVGKIKRERKFNKGTISFIKNNNVINTCYLNKNSDVKIKIYNKTNEMQNGEKKEYIRKFWEANDMEICKTPVWRLEFSLHHLGQRGNSIFINKENISTNLFLFDDKKNIYFIVNLLIAKYLNFKYLEKWEHLTKFKSIENIGFEKLKEKNINFHASNYTRGFENFIQKIVDDERTKKIFDNDQIKALLTTKLIFQQINNENFVLPVSNTGTPRLNKLLKHRQLEFEFIKKAAEILPDDKKTYLIEYQRDNGEWEIYETSVKIADYKKNNININKIK